MKKIFRMIVFSFLAVYLTSLWNQGFFIQSDFYVLLKTALLVAAIYYVIRPITKLILLPLNILTLGLVSTAVYCLLFYFATNAFSLILIDGWIFQSITISKTANIFVSALSVSAIINSLEHIL